MAHLRPASQYEKGYGFDPGNSVLSIPVRQSATVYLVAGEDLTVDIPQQSVATFTESEVTAKDLALSTWLTPWEKTQNLRRLTISGVTVGSAVLSAITATDRRPWVKPLQIAVVNDPDGRQIVLGQDKQAAADSWLAQKLPAKSFREALLWVAQDQMYSKIGRTAHAGDGRYGLAVGAEWCGAFVQWCYIATASVNKKAQNPFGNHIDPLNSPQKAIGWALHYPDKAQLLRYEGGDPFGWMWKPDGTYTDKNKSAYKQSFVDIGAANPVLPGDVCLVRDQNAADWKHVCMVYEAPDASGDFSTIDGNQTGAYRPGAGYANECIGINTHNANAKVADGSGYQFVFLHLTGIGT